MESLILQPNNHHCGPAAVVNAIYLLGGHADYDEVVRLAGTNKNGTSWTGLFNAFDGLGYRTAEYQTNCERNAWAFLKYWKGRAPLIAWMHSSDHYVVVSGVVSRTVAIIDSDRAKAREALGVKTYDRNEWLQEWKYRGLFEAIRIWKPKTS